jgi:hypothetical protein
MNTGSTGKHEKKADTGIERSESKRFNSPESAISQLNLDFNDWSAILTHNSVNASYAIIAANWAVHGSSGNILGNSAAKWSIGITIIFLGVNLLASFLMSKMHYDQFLYAERNPEKWSSEWQNSKNHRHWPYTEGIEFLGVTIRRIKVIAPIVSCLLFVVSLF